MKRKILPYNRRLKKVARMLRKNMPLSEVLLWQELKTKNLLGYDFDRQRPIGNYIVDFYCKELQLAIEIDGDSHSSQKIEKRDRQRQKELEFMGVDFLRFDDTAIKNNISDVIAVIQEWILNKNPPLPLPGGD